MEEGIVYKTTGSGYILKYQDDFLNARLKGIHKKDKKTTFTNPIAVGDKVLFEQNDTSDETDYMITEILPRENYIVRSSPHNSRQKHIIASNLDQAILMATLKNPRTSLGFIDRFLISSEMYHIPTRIFFNKSDTYGEEEISRYHEIKEIYEEVGYPCYLISSLEDIAPDVIDLLRDKFSLLSGHSGVGKSTFLNRILPENRIKTAEVSESTGKGMHTTTFAEAYDLREGGAIVDTPGIRELGLTDLEPSELAGYYPEMRALAGECAFNDCLHIEEPKCAVKAEVEKSISLLRYQNYRSILDTIESPSY